MDDLIRNPLKELLTQDHRSVGEQRYISGFNEVTLHVITFTCLKCTVQRFIL